MRRTARPVHLGICVLLAALAITPAILMAQQQRGARRGQAPARAPTPAPARAAAPAIVIVTKTDTTTVRGTLLSSDFDEVIVQPALRPGERTPGEPVTVRWGQILRVSNGLTRMKILEDFKKANLANLCDTCHGDRLAFCATCKGTGNEPSSGADCPTCKGELLVDCKTPKCDDGKVVCPNADCLKLSVGTWAARPDGLKWRTFPNPGGGGGGRTVSERHVGELMLRTGNSWALSGKCPTCNGTTSIFDPVCHATGKMPCATCVARKEVPDCTAGCEVGQIACAECKGTGLKAGATLAAPGTATPGTPAQTDPVDPIDNPQ